MTLFVRSWLLLKHTTGAPVLLAVEILVDQYAGGVKELAQQVGRNTSGDAIRVLETAMKRRFNGVAVLNSNHNGTDFVTYNSVNYIKATPAQIEACYTKTDLEASSFEDSSGAVPVFWDAIIRVDYDPRVIYQPTGDVRVTPFSMMEK